MPNAVEALQLWAEDMSVPEPSSHEAIVSLPDIRAALSEGAYLVSVPLIDNDSAVVRANVTFERGVLRAIDAAARARYYQICISLERCPQGNRSQTLAALHKDFDRSASVNSVLRWQVARVGDWPKRAIAIVIPGRSRSEAPSRRPWNPCHYLRQGVQRSRILHRGGASKSRHGFYGLRRVASLLAPP